MLEIGARPFAAMIEETDIVVLTLQRPDFALDEVVESDKQFCHLLGNREIHDITAPNSLDCRPGNCNVAQATRETPFPEES